MSETILLALSCGAGGVLGLFFFGGLWWTIRKGATSSHPALLFLSSLLVRMSATLLGFYFVSHGQIGQLLACLLGFVLARIVVLQLTKPPLDLYPHRAGETDHATQP